MFRSSTSLGCPFFSDSAWGAIGRCADTVSPLTLPPDQQTLPDSMTVERAVPRDNQDEAKNNGVVARQSRHQTDSVGIRILSLSHLSQTQPYLHRKLNCAMEISWSSPFNFDQIRQGGQIAEDSVRKFRPIRRTATPASKDSAAYRTEAPARTVRSS